MSVTHTHAQTTGQSAAGRIVGPALQCEASDPSDWNCQVLSVRALGWVAQWPWSMPEPPHSGGPGAPAWRRVLIVEPSLHEDASSYFRHRCMNSWPWPSVSGQAPSQGGRGCFCSDPQAADPTSQREGCGSRDWPLQREKTCLPMPVCPPDCMLCPGLK